MKLITKLMHKFNVLTVKIIMKSVVQFCSVTALFESIAYLEKHNTSYQKNIVIRFLCNLNLRTKLCLQFSNAYLHAEIPKGIRHSTVITIGSSYC